MRNQANNRSNKYGKDFGKYAKHMGETGLFFKNTKDKTGVTGIFSQYAVKGGKIVGLLATVKGHIWPQFFEKADFTGANGTVACTCGKTYKLVEVTGKDKNRSGKRGNNKDNSNRGNGRNKVTDGRFSNKGSADKAIALFHDIIDGNIDIDDDGDYKDYCNTIANLH